ncbi:MAG: glycosyltransferase family 87 protein [Crocinitomicaceae bacterium]
MKTNLVNIISNKKILIPIFVGLSIFASIQPLFGTKSYYEGGKEYNRYNNYTIFEKSFEHLHDHKDLYRTYPEEHWDLYKYTPTFAVFFGIFHIFPDWLGLNLWNLLNVLLLVFAVYCLPKFTDLQKGWILVFLVFELMTSIQSQQSNALLAGLFILAYGLLSRNKYMLATLCIVFAIFVKPFGIVGFTLFLLYPKKWQSALFALGWATILFLLPLVFISIEEYKILYQNYFDLLASDHEKNALFQDLGTTYGYSVMGWLNSWFALENGKNYIVAFGILIFLIPLAKVNFHKDSRFQFLLLSSILIWVVIFNHKAESATYILAMAGVSIWFVMSEKNWLNILLFICAIIFTSLSPTDIFPKEVREEIVKPYTLKAVPCILIWLKIIFDMLALKQLRSTH